VGTKQGCFAGHGRVHSRCGGGQRPPGVSAGDHCPLGSPQPE